MRSFRSLCACWCPRLEFLGIAKLLSGHGWGHSAPFPDNPAWYSNARLDARLRTQAKERGVGGTAMTSMNTDTSDPFPGTSPLTTFRRTRKVLFVVHAFRLQGTNSTSLGLHSLVKNGSSGP